MASCGSRCDIGWSIGARLWYDGDLNSCEQWRMDLMKEKAELAIDVYNKTHLNKYSFVELVHVMGHHLGFLRLDMIFTAKPEPERDGEDNNPIKFRTWIDVPSRFVEYVDILQEYVHFPEVFEKKETKIFLLPENYNLGSVLYDKDHPYPTFCNGETMKIVNQCVDLALDVYSKTHPVTYKLVDLVHATGAHLSAAAGFMVDVTFTAKVVPTQNADYKIPKTLQTRVSVAHNYVEFVTRIGSRD